MAGFSMRTRRSHGVGRRRLSLETLENRLLLDGGAAELADDLFEVHQNGEALLLDVLANDTFPVDYTGDARITSVSYGSQGGRVEIAVGADSISYVPPADFAGH